MTYSTLSSFAQTVGLIYFIGMFLAVIFYAFRNKNRTRFEQAAHIPLREDD